MSLQSSVKAMKGSIGLIGPIDTRKSNDGHGRRKLTGEAEKELRFEIIDQGKDLPDYPRTASAPKPAS